MSKELALKLAPKFSQEYQDHHQATRFSFTEQTLVEYTTRYHAAMMEKYGKGFDEWMLANAHDPIFLYEDGATDIAASMGWKAGAASREPELQALREENERLNRQVEGYAAYHSIEARLTATREALAEAEIAIELMASCTCRWDVAGRTTHGHSCYSSLASGVLAKIDAARKEGE